MDSAWKWKQRIGLGVFVSVCLVLFTLSLIPSVGILVMERKCSIQIYFLKCVLISKTECKVYSWCKFITFLFPVLKNSDANIFLILILQGTCQFLNLQRRIILWNWTTYLLVISQGFAIEKSCLLPPSFLSPPL